MFTLDDVITLDEAEKLKELVLPKISEEQKAEIRESVRLAYYRNKDFKFPDAMSLIGDHLKSLMKEQEQRLEFALRYLIPNPIKGEITKGKLKWRGISLYIPQGGGPRLIEKDDGNVVVKDVFYFPILLGKASKSGKRPAFRMNLNFEGDQLTMYRHYTLYGTIKNFRLRVAEHKAYIEGTEWENPAN